MNVIREEIVGYLGDARPLLSMELERMQQEGTIRIDGREVLISSQELFVSLFE